jgi:RHS repeat-associated protein
VFAPAGGPPGAPIQWGDTITNNTVEAGFGYVGTGSMEETLRYFYHTDHLGSTSYITDAVGNAVQHVSYLPFGETFAEQHSAYDSPYQFNGKELDAETGLYYYGARYYDPKTSVFMGVDPLAEKSGTWSPYTYCKDNPIRLIDPDGMDPDDPPTLKQIVSKGIRSSTTFTSLMKNSNISIKNYSKYISFGDETSTDVNSGEIVLTKGIDIKFQIMLLTQELSNRDNLKSEQKLLLSVEKGEISPKNFAKNGLKLKSKEKLTKLK